MELIGKIVAIIPAVSGTSAKGPWKKQEFILETETQFPKKLCLINWNDKVNIDNMQHKTVKVFFDVESREFNGKWFTEAKVWKLDESGKSEEAPETTFHDKDAQPEDIDLTDDLPF